MHTSILSRHFMLASLRVLLALLVLLPLSVINQAAEPGSAFPFSSVVSDQKAGSMLIYNIYTSSVTQPQLSNTLISITNTNGLTDTAAHLFFVDGETCSIADAYICLTRNQTVSFMAADIDPGVTGYLVVLAVDPATGCPTNFNYLIGDEYVKLSSGHHGGLGAEALAALSTNFTCGDGVATLRLDGSFAPGSYNELPRTLAFDNLSSRGNGNSQYLVINRIGGNLATGTLPVGSMFGLLFDDAENAYSFILNGTTCQLKGEIGNNFPRMTPRIETVIPQGRSGWLKLSSDNTGAGILGAGFDKHPNPDTVANAFNGAHNLHKLTLNSNNTAPNPTLVVPVFPPNC